VRLVFLEIYPQDDGIPRSTAWCGTSISSGPNLRITFSWPTLADDKLLEEAILKELGRKWNSLFVNDAGNVWTGVLWVCSTRQ